MPDLRSVFDDILSPHDAVRLAQRFKALASPHRLRIISLLAHTPDGMTQQQICAHIPVDQATVSMHMRQLRAAFLVDLERRGKYVTYRLTPGAVQRLGALLGGAR